jgi:hypothetical protein
MGTMDRGGSDHMDKIVLRLGAKRVGCMKESEEIGEKGGRV